MEQSVVKAAKASSSGPSGNSWATSAGATRTVKSPSIIATGVNIAGFRSAFDPG